MDSNPPATGTASDFGNMLNEYIPRGKKKKKKEMPSFNPWLKIKTKSQEHK